MGRLKANLLIADNPYSSISRGELYRNENNDCSVQAIAIVCGVTYAEAHEACKAEGREDGDGMRCYDIDSAIESLGFKVARRDKRLFIDQYPGAHKNLRNVTTHQPHRFNKVWADGKTYLFFVKGHVAAVVDGVNGDWCRRKSMRVWRIVEVTKINNSEVTIDKENEMVEEKKMAVKRGNKIVEEGWMAIEDVPMRAFMKRRPDASTTYVRGTYYRPERKYACDDWDDISRDILLKKGTMVYVGFTI